MKYLQDALKRLETDASRRRERLQENASLLQFMWKADVVESWIGKFRAFPIVSGSPAIPMMTAPTHTCCRETYAARRISFASFLYSSGEKLHQLRTDDLGHNLLSVQNLLTRHETFEAGLNNFEHEGIRSVTELRDELVATSRGSSSSSSSEQADKIQARYDLVLSK